MSCRIEYFCLINAHLPEIQSAIVRPQDKDILRTVYIHPTKSIRSKSIEKHLFLVLHASGRVTRPTPLRGRRRHRSLLSLSLFTPFSLYLPYYLLNFFPSPCERTSMRVVDTWRTHRTEREERERDTERK